MKPPELEGKFGVQSTTILVLKHKNCSPVLASQGFKDLGQRAQRETEVARL